MCLSVNGGSTAAWQAKLGRIIIEDGRVDRPRCMCFLSCRLVASTRMYSDEHVDHPKVQLGLGRYELSLTADAFGCWKAWLEGVAGRIFVRAKRIVSRNNVVVFLRCAENPLQLSFGREGNCEACVDEWSLRQDFALMRNYPRCILPSVQAYSEDDDLFKMLVDARRKAFPVPLKSISSALESRPIASLGVYVTVIVSVASVAIGLVLAWVSGEAGSAQSVAMMGTMGSSVGGARVLGAGESAGGGANSDSVESIMDGRDVESVPVTALLWMMGGSLALGLAPSLILAVGYKRRTAAFWRSVRERDMEILRRQEHLLQPRLSPVAVSAPPGFDPASANVSVGPAMDVVGGSRPSTGATTGIGTGGGPIATPAASATSAVDPVIESAPRQISRGEQAVQEIVMARLSRLQQPPPGGAAPPRVTPVLHPRGLSLHAAPYAHRQALQPADFARHQHDVRNSPAVAVAGTTLPPGGYIYGMAGNGATLAMAGGVGRGMGYGSGMGGAAIPEGVGGPVAPSHSGGGSGGRPVQSIQVPQ